MKLTIDQAYSPRVLRRLQMVEYDILKKFDAMCKKHGLQYFAMYGTLLGAVRHQGIIPWDDDIDVVMPRKDYEKILELIPLEMGDEYTFLDGSTNPKYPYVNGRIMKKGTQFVVYAARKFPIEQGIFLDIYVMDNLPDDKKKRKAMLRKTWILEKLCIVRTNPYPLLPFKGVKKAFVQAVCFVASGCLKLIPAHVYHDMRIRESAKYKNEKTDLCAVLTGIDFNHHNVFPREDIFPLGEMRYEDMMIPTPHHALKLLEKTYGPNYMTPPPEGKRSNIIAYKLSFGDEEGHEEINE